MRTLPSRLVRCARLLPTFAVVTALGAVASVPLSGQAAPLVIEVRGGSSVPFDSFDRGARPGEGVGAGPSFGLAFGLARGARRTLTFGFSQHRFPCGDAGCDVGGRWVATGVDLGMRVNLATTGDVIPWIRVAGVTTRVELDDHADYRDAVSALGFGGEVGIGLYIGAFEQVALNPGVRATAVNTTLPGGALLRMRFLVADIGLAVAF